MNVSRPINFLEDFNLNVLKITCLYIAYQSIICCSIRSLYLQSSEEAKAGYRSTPKKQAMPSIAMATKSCLLLCLMVSFLHQLLSAPVAATSPKKSDGRDVGRGKTLSFTVYQQETINKTAYIVVDGVAGAGVSQTTTPFGTVYVFRDDLTVHADRASPVAGVVEGTSITTTLDGLQSLSLAKITIDHRGHRGSVSVLGGTYNTKPSDYPVLGGTGDFAYALGYVRSSPVDLRGRSVTYKMELHLYWPLYAHDAPVPHKP